MHGIIHSGSDGMNTIMVKIDYGNHKRQDGYVVYLEGLKSWGGYIEAEVVPVGPFDISRFWPDYSGEVVSALIILEGTGFEFIGSGPLKFKGEIL